VPGLRSETGKSNIEFKEDLHPNPRKGKRGKGREGHESIKGKKKHLAHWVKNEFLVQRKGEKGECQILLDQRKEEEKGKTRLPRKEKLRELELLQRTKKRRGSFKREGFRKTMSHLC